jgi:hypothetical protein
MGTFSPRTGDYRRDVVSFANACDATMTAAAWMAVKAETDEEEDAEVTIYKRHERARNRARAILQRLDAGGGK